MKIKYRNNQFNVLDGKVTVGKGVAPECEDGAVTGLRYIDLKTDEVVTIELPDGVEGWLSDHPEGSDRGGYVPYLTVGDITYYYDENADEWLE